MNNIIPRTPAIRRAGNPGFTLIEVLIALSLACIVTVAVMAIYQAVSVTTAALRRQHGIDEAVGVAFDKMRRDLACAIAMAPDMGAPLMISSAPVEGVESSSVILHTAVEKTTGGTTTWSIDRVVYQVEQDPASETGGRLLVRLAGEAAVMTEPVMSREELVKRPERLTVSVSDGTNWYSRWPVEGSRPLPAAVKMVLEWKSEDGIHSASSMATIRAGQTWTPAAPKSRAQTPNRGFAGRFISPGGMDKIKRSSPGK